MKVQLTTVTNVHIGSGDEAFPFEYISLGKRKTARINYMKALTSLLKNFPGKANQLEDFIDETSENLVNLPNTKGRLNKKFDLLNIIDRFNIDLKKENLEDYLSENSCIRYYATSENEIDNQVREHIRDGNNDLYVPGSSIKGALVTVLLKNALTSESDSSINEVGRLFRALKGMNNLKWYDDPTQNYFGFDAKEVIYTLASCIIVSDAYPEKRIMGNIEHPKIFTKKKRDQDQLDIVEFIPKRVDLRFNIDFNAELFRSVVDHYELKKTEMLPDLIGISIEDVKHLSNEEIRNAFFDHLSKSNANSTDGLVEIERKWSNVLSSELIDFKENFDSLYEKAFKTHPEIFIKIGWGSQFHGMTMFDPLLLEADLSDRKGELARFIRKNVNMQKEQKKTFDKHKLDHFPNSRRVIKEEEKYGLIGWFGLKFLE